MTNDEIKAEMEKIENKSATDPLFSSGDARGGVYYASDNTTITKLGNAISKAIQENFGIAYDLKPIEIMLVDKQGLWHIVLDNRILRDLEDIGIFTKKTQEALSRQEVLQNAQFAKEQEANFLKTLAEEPEKEQPQKANTAIEYTADQLDALERIVARKYGLTAHELKLAANKYSEELKRRKKIGMSDNDTLPGGGASR